MIDSELLRLGRPAETELFPCPQAIEPAEGQERLTLEQQINPLTNGLCSPFGFASFVDGMIRLLGGARIMLKREGANHVITTSRVIVDHNTYAAFQFACWAGKAGRNYTLTAGPDWMGLLPYPRDQEVIDGWGNEIMRERPAVQEDLSVMVSASGGISDRVRMHLLPRTPTGCERVITSLLFPQGVSLTRALEGGSQVASLDVPRICRIAWDPYIKASTDGRDASFYAEPLSVVGHP